MPVDAQKSPFDKSKLPNRHVRARPRRVLHHSMFYATGVIEGQFIIGVFEGVGVGVHIIGKTSESERHEPEYNACRFAGSRADQFTANTMACVYETIGLTEPDAAGRADAWGEGFVVADSGPAIRSNRDAPTCRSGSSARVCWRRGSL